MELIQVPVKPGEWLDDVVQRACRIAMRNDRRVGFRFNGIAIQVSPLDEPQDIVNRYHRDVALAE